MDERRIILYFTRMRWNELVGRIRLVGHPMMHICERGWRWEWKSFVDFDLWVVLAGEGGLKVNGGDVPVARGEGILFRPGDSVKGWHDPNRPLRVFSAHFVVEGATHTWLCDRVPRRVRIHDAARFELLAGELAQRALLEDLTDGWAELQLASILAEAARDVGARPTDPVEERLRRICQEISTNPAADWQPERLARETGLSLSQFNRRFRAFTGTSAARYLIARRVDRAKKLLAETPMTLQEISDALGYSDVYYFHRQFRAETGKTPRAARVVAREAD